MPSYNEASRKVPPKAEDRKITNTAGEKVGRRSYSFVIKLFKKTIINVGGQCYSFIKYPKRK
jgi:hypothetical protein